MPYPSRMPVPNNLVRRMSVWGIVLGISALSQIAAARSPDATRDAFAIPRAAIVRSLGEIAQAPCAENVSQVCQGAPENPSEALKGSYPLDVAGLGIPLGGIGAGAFMINQSGSFGPWNFGGSQGDHWEIRSLPQAAFHLREQYGDEPATVRTLATRGPDVRGSIGPVSQRSWASPLSAWHILAPGEGRYAALYPFGWINYTPFKTDVSMRFFSPIVVREDRRSSLPVAYFDIRVANVTGKLGRISVMFTMPNAPPHVGRVPETIRKGFSSQDRFDAVTGVRGISLSADDPANTPDALNSEWTIAVLPQPGQDVSFTTSWNGDGDGADIYAPFERDGKLGNKPIDQSHSAGALSVSLVLKPGEVATIPFVLSWDFPQVAFSNNRSVWMRRYTNFYGARETSQNDYVSKSYPFHQSFNIADDALSGHDKALRDVLRWWQPIADEPAYPLVLRTAALNQLYQLAFNNSFWEGGLVSNDISPTFGRRMGALHADTHLFATIDSGSGGGTGNGIDVNAYCYSAYNLLFPGLERDRLRAFAEATMAAPDWTDDFVSVADSPYVEWHKIEAPAPGNVSYLDVPAKLIYRDYAAAQASRDDALLREFYPAMQKALRYMQGAVPAGRHLPSPASISYRVDGDGSNAIHGGQVAASAMPGGLSFANTYDILPVNGIDVYDAQLYLLSLEVLIDSGQRLRENPASVDALRGELKLAKAEFEASFWDSKDQFYRFTPLLSDDDGVVLLDSFFAQHIAERLGLPDLVNIERYHTQLSRHFDEFFRGRDADGRSLGAANMALGQGLKTWPYISMFGIHQEEDVWVGANYFTGAVYYAAGQRFNDLLLKKRGIQMASTVAEQTWNVAGNAFTFDTPEAWNGQSTALYTYPAYERPLDIWELLDVIKPLPFAHENRTHGHH